MYKNTPFFLLFALAILTYACADKSTPAELLAIGTKIDDTYTQVIDLNYKELYTLNATLKNERLTEAIQAYQNAKNPVSKIQVFEKYDGFYEHPSYKWYLRQLTENQTKRTAERSDWFLINYGQDKFSDQDFDLFTQNNDLLVAQVKVLNQAFNDLDDSTLDAIAFYEKLSPDQKKSMLLSGKGFTAGPVEYPARFIGRELTRYYFQRRAMLTEQLRQRLLARKFINEFPQGFLKNNPGIGGLSPQYDDRQFDLVTQKN